MSSIKRELERLGCYHGRVDEDWTTPRTKRSVNEFARLAHLEAPHVPDAALLEILKAQRVRVCPWMCGPRQVKRGGACIAKTCPRGERLDEEGDCVAPPPKRVVPPLIRHAAPTPVRPEPTRPAAPPKRVPSARHLNQLKIRASALSYRHQLHRLVPVTEGDVSCSKANLTVNKP